VQGYRVYYGTASGAYQQSFGAGFNAGSATSYSISSLPTGRTYYFSVTSVDANGNESAYSSEASKLVQ
jgi:fibronectin type 3 domain-containing protein